MATEIAYPHIEKRPNEPACLARLPRIRVAQIVMDHLAHGWSVDEICRQHSYLLPAVAHSAMVYYFDHRTEIDAEIEQELSTIEDARQQLPESPIAARLRAQRRRYPWPWDGANHDRCPTGSESTLSDTPIPGTTLRMSHCDDDYLVVRHAKNDPKRKSSQSTFAMECVYCVKRFWISLYATK